jgi:hypothetical protein
MPVAEFDMVNILQDVLAHSVQNTSSRLSFWTTSDLSRTDTRQIRGRCQTRGMYIRISLRYDRRGQEKERH